MDTLQWKTCREPNLGHDPGHQRILVGAATGRWTSVNPGPVSPERQHRRVQSWRERDRAVAGHSGVSVCSLVLPTRAMGALSPHSMLCAAICEFTA